MRYIGIILTTIVVSVAVFKVTTDNMLAMIGFMGIVWIAGYLSRE